ncbi:MAG: hypothetical protein Q8R55_07275 [Candidatus Taylorbacteria bacterium]|nr:hypothetical protein [Candidatus Taylorbacteria bacterium]
MLVLETEDFGGRFKKEEIVRQDMAKVVTERPRYGHANRSKKTALRVRRYEEGQLDDLPKRISSSRHRQHGWDAKEFSDLIGPLKRFLQSRIGQHWDKVYSELSQSLDKRSLTGRHIWQHVWIEVERNPRIGSDGQVRAGFPYSYVVHGLYIHPKTGVLSWAGRRK